MKRLNFVLSVLFAIATASAAWAQNPCNPCGPKKAANPCNPCGNKAMKVAVNPCFAKMGTVFYISDPMGRNVVSFESQAPLEDMVGTTNAISGYVVFDPRQPEAGVRGEIVVPVATLNTGIPLRDEHLRGPMWLNAEKHPYIKLQVDNVEDVESVKSGEGYTTYGMMAVGNLTINGRTRRIGIPVKVTYLKETALTQQKLPGDLLASRGSFQVALDEYGIQGFEGVVGSKVSKTIDVTVSFMATNKNPETAMNPGNPCNPCGGKAKAGKASMSASNPCGK